MDNILWIVVLGIIKKASQSSLPAGSESCSIIFSGGVYVGKDTSQASSVGPLALRAAA